MEWSVIVLCVLGSVGLQGVQGRPSGEQSWTLPRSNEFHEFGLKIRGQQKYQDSLQTHQATGHQESQYGHNIQEVSSHQNNLHLQNNEEVSHNPEVPQESHQQFQPSQKEEESFVDEWKGIHNSEQPFQTHLGDKEGQFFSKEENEGQTAKQEGNGDAQPQIEHNKFLVDVPNFPPKIEKHEEDHHHEVKTVTVTKHVPVPYTVEVEKKVPYKVEVPVDKPYSVEVPKPYPVYVEKKVPYTVKEYYPQPYTVYKKVPVPVKVHVDRPYTVHVPKPYHVLVEKKVPYSVEKHVPYPQRVYVDKPYAVHYPVYKPVPYTVEKKVHYPVEIPVEKPVPVAVPKPYKVS